MDPSTRPNPEQRNQDGGPSIGRQLRDDGRQRLDATRKSAADQVAGIADAFDAARSQLETSQPTLAHYTSKLADGVGRAASKLRDSSVEDLARDVRRFAARNPAIFVLASAAAGVVLARFLKTTIDDGSPRRAGDDEYADSYTPTSGTGLESRRTDTARAVSAEEGEPAVGAQPYERQQQSH